MDNEPRICVSDLIAGLLVYAGYIFFLVVVHILTINSDGNVNSVLNTVFQVSLYIYIGLIIFGVVAVIAQLLRWLTWSVKTPGYKKRRGY